jgi:hypothetical protein
LQHVNRASGAPLEAYIRVEGKMKRLLFRRLVVLLGLVAALMPLAVSAHDGPFIGPFNTVTQIASTVPGNGDVNPYGIDVVDHSAGALTSGSILVSNFNNSSNLQGTGTTIVEIAPNGSSKLFAQIDPAHLPGACPGGVGLTTALVVLHKGWVIVGSLPTTDGTAATAQAGCLIVLDRNGKVVETISGPSINGPWDMTARDNEDSAQIYVANVLNGTVAGNGNEVDQGTVVRIELKVPDKGMPSVRSITTIGSSFPEKTDPAALVIGPTGLALSHNGTLYVADTLSNRIAEIDAADRRKTSAGIGMTVSKGGALNGPLGLTLAPNGDILAANAGDGNLVETTPHGAQVSVKTVEAAGAGALFGLIVAPNDNGVYFVDDATNALNLLH